MKIKLRPIGIITLFIFSYIIYVVFLAILGLPNPVYKSAPDFINSNNELKPIDAIIPDSISYRKYSDQKDSIRIIRDLKNADYFPSAGINFFNVIATGGSIECDTCSLKWYKNVYLEDKNDKPVNTLSYIQLPSWKINNKAEGNTWWTKDSVQFYAEHGQAYIRKYIVYSLSQNDSVRPSYHMVDIPVKFRYNKRDQCVMIPVSKAVEKTVDISFTIFAFAFIGYLFILIGDFIGFLMDLSKGLAFTNRNLRTLKRITITLFAIPVTLLLFNLLLRLIFMSYLTSDVVLKIDILDGYWKFLTCGVIFLMIYRAFRQGKKLKDEQELTI